MRDQSLGSIIGNKYRLGPILGRGGMGVVREATHVRLGTKFAVKLLHEASDQLDRSRFEREALAASALHNRHVVRVFDIGETAEGTPFMVMELLRGRDVMQVYRDEPELATARVVDWMIQVCSAMFEAHNAGIVHRDLKPSNLFVSERGSQELVKVVDFGISKVLSAKELTVQSSFVGTPQYMAPEQLRGESSIDHRADIWAMGVILYRLLSRRYPFHTADDMSPIVAALANLTAIPIPLESVRPDLAPPLVATIMRTLSRAVDDRFADARELARALAPFGSGSVQFDESDEDTRSELLDRLHDATPMFSLASASTVVGVPQLAAPSDSEPVGGTENQAVAVSATRSRTPMYATAAVLAVLVIGAGVAFGAMRTHPAEPFASEAPKPPPMPTPTLAPFETAPHVTADAPTPVPIAPASSAASRTLRPPVKPAVSRESPPSKSPSLPVHL